MLPSSTAVEVAGTWHYLAECQRALDAASKAARDRAALSAPHAEDADRIGVSIDAYGDRVVLRVELVDARPESLRAWVTPDLALLRARGTDDRLVERLVRLPATVDAESAEIERTDGSFAITLDRRPPLPHSLWPPLE
jgi:HSP20 family molecular chaperone IbpA